MKTYDEKSLSFGSELEIADVPKSLKIPPELGAWEYSETDIVNTLPPYRGMAVDPAGINPPVGGEINTYPTRTVEEQEGKIMKIIKLIRKAGYEPIVSPVAEMHHHVHVDDLRNDIPALKRLTKYVKANQKDWVDAVWSYEEHPGFKGLPPAVKMFYKFDGGRLMPDWMADNIINRTKTFDDFIFLHAAGKDGVSRGRPFRYSVNMYCLKHTDTIEFRCFRASFERKHIHDSLMACKLFILNALNDGVSVKQFIKDFEFPPMVFDRELVLSWYNSKHEPNLAGKNRKYYEVG